MCIVCVLWDKGRITTKEADKALTELFENNEISPEHAFEVATELDKSEVPDAS